MCIYLNVPLALKDQSTINTYKLVVDGKTKQLTQRMCQSSGIWGYDSSGPKVKAQTTHHLTPALLA